MFETTILAVLQGIAEFIPISSSGHLVLGKALLGVKEPGIRLDIFLHVGTLFAIAAFYWRVIWKIVRGAFTTGDAESLPLRQSWSYIAKIVVSAIPAGVIGVLFKDQLEEFFSSPHAVGAALLFTGIVLLATKVLPKGERDVSFLGAIVMGVAQAVAILPGVSRSGMTLAAARASKIEAAKSAEFSFLMSAPPIAGAALLEVLKAMKESCPNCPSTETAWPLVIYGGVLAAVVGYFSLAFLLKALKSDRFWMFGPYCLLAGGITLILV